MRDEEDGSGKRLERRLERLAALEIEVVRRLVEDEEVGPRCDEKREREPPPLASGERRDLSVRGSPSRRRGSGRAASGPAVGEVAVAAAAQSSTEPVFGSSCVCWEKYAGDDAVPDAATSPGIELPVAEQRRQKRRLSAPVRADQRDLLAPVDREACILEEQLVARFEPDSLCLEHDLAGARGVQEVEAQRPSSCA